MAFKFNIPVLTGLLLFVFAKSVDAQQAPLKFNHLSFKEGLAQSPISTIVKDSKGFIWLGSWKGLTRYDGYTFRTFKHQNQQPKSISNNRVNAIVEDKKGKLWIGTSNGLNIYNPATEVFKRVDIRDIKGGRNYISSVLLDSYQNVWTATFAGVKLVDTQKWVLKEQIGLKDTSLNSLYSAVAFTMFEDNAKRVWVGSKNGVKLFNPKSRKVLQLPNAIANSEELNAAKIIVIRQDKAGNLWFGSETAGLFRYEPKNDRLKVFKNQDNNSKSILSNWIRDVYIYDAQQIWVGTRNGLSIFDTQTEQFTNHTHSAVNPNSLSDNTIWSFMQDDASGIWIGTFAGGLNVYYPSNANFGNIGERIGDRMGLSHLVANAISEDKAGGLWVGTYGGGINYLNRNTGDYRYFDIRNDQKQTRNGVKSLAEDADGNLWVGTLDGLCHFNKETKKIRFFKFAVTQGKFSENLINSIVPEADGVWVGTNGGGMRYLKPDGTYRTFVHSPQDKTSISDNFVVTLIKDAQSNLWIGTQNGLNYYDRRKDTFKRFIKRNKPNTLSNNSIITMFKDSKDRLWIGTDGGGLNYYNPITDKFYALNEEESLTDDVIHAIVEDDRGDIWISTDDGLYKLHFKNFNLPFSAKNVAITHYNANDGLASNQFQTNAGLKLKSGELLFGGINGLTSFFPDRLIKNELKPKVAFTDFLIRNRPALVDSANSPLKKSVTFSDHIELKYDEGYITIKFAALNFINPEKNQYAYKMEGIRGDDWHYSGTQREANYTNLSPGNYTFMVMAANNDGLWNTEPITLSITVLPPWWQTWWAFVIYAAIIYYIALTIYKFQKNRLKLKRELYLEHLEKERQEELHQMKIDFFTNISHEIRTPLTLILGPIEKMLMGSGLNAAASKQLTQVQHNANRLMRLVTELMDFRKAESGHMKLAFSACNLVQFAEEIYLSFQTLAQDKQIVYQFESNVKELEVYFDKDHLEKVLFNLLSNAFKFTPEKGKITFKIEAGENSVSVKVIDTGRGISQKNIEQLFTKFFQVYNEEVSNSGYGIGLALSKNIVELHKGTIDVVSDIEDEQNKETTFTVTLPLGAAHLDSNSIIPEYMNSDNPVHYYLQSAANDIITENEQETVDHKYTILVIEDNLELRNFIKDSFKNQYRVVEAANGVQGLEMALSELPDLIISDVMMPEMDGLELCRRIKTDERINHIPVVLLTARAAYIHQINGYEKGADAYITKPFSTQILALNVKNILATKEAGRQKFVRDILLNPEPVKIESPDDKFLAKLMQIIEQNLDNTDFDVTALTQEIGMSKTVLYKKVQAITNLSVADLIKSIRLKQAAYLLESNQMTVAEVAFAVGFNDRKYFSKEFKKQYDVSPSEYLASKQ
ncbi:MAG: two-component regulator propeller domain-containing protein [Pedobacter sp.]|uniref:hybrid sensor histidine kinase/response regulator transcription factor n=1 Tax=Pedobacter sp. TaxID=1411316 RepID=UPI002806AB54|nr:two-component regulator propeller domain-containing protein [Pedobacter sp.]MDQ8005331.1 two-component regulator propeller domain-containing protein [Pedobacter sp.]